MRALDFSWFSSLFGRDFLEDTFVVQRIKDIKGEQAMGPKEFREKVTIRAPPAFISKVSFSRTVFSI